MKTITLTERELKGIIILATEEAIENMMSRLKEDEMLISPKRIEQLKRAEDELNNQNDELLTGKQVAQMLSISQPQVTQMKQQGLLPYIVINKTAKYRKSEIIDFLNKRSLNRKRVG